MKTPAKVIILSMATLLGAGGILPAQTAVSRPDTAPKVAAPRLNTGAAATTPGPRRGGTAPAQTRLEFARVNLLEAKRALEAAAPDKGGFREKALQNVDEALKNIEQGMALARGGENAGGGNRGITLPGGPTAAPAK